MPNHRPGIYTLLWSLISLLERNLVSIALPTSFMGHLIHFTFKETMKQRLGRRGAFHQGETKRCKKRSRIERLIGLCHCMSLLHCEPLVECDCSPDWCNDRSSWGRKIAGWESLGKCFCRPIIPFIESQEILIGVGSGYSGQMCKDKQSRPSPPRTTDHKHLSLTLHPAELNLNTHTHLSRTHTHCVHMLPMLQLL